MSPRDPISLIIKTSSPLKLLHSYNIRNFPIRKRKTEGFIPCICLILCSEFPVLQPLETAKEPFACSSAKDSFAELPE